MATMMNAMTPAPRGNDSKEMVEAAAASILRKHQQQYGNNAEHAKNCHACALMGMALRMRKPYCSTAIQTEEQEHPWDEDFLRPAVLGAAPREPSLAFDGDNDSHCSDVTDTSEVHDDEDDDQDKQQQVLLNDDHSYSSASSVHSDCATVKQGNRLVQECSYVELNNDNNKISLSVSKDESEGEQSDDTATTEEDDDVVSTSSSDGSMDISQLQNHDQLALRERKNSWFRSWWKESSDDEEEEDVILTKDDDVCSTSSSSSSSDGSMDISELQNHDQLALRERKNSWFRSWWKESSSQGECSDEEDDILTDAAVAVNPVCSYNEEDVEYYERSFESTSTNQGEQDWTAQLSDIEKELDDVLESQITQTAAASDEGNNNLLFDADFDSIAATIPESSTSSDEEHMDDLIEIVSSEEDLFSNINKDEAPVEEATQGKTLVEGDKTTTTKTTMRTRDATKRVSFNLARNSTLNLEPVIITGDVTTVDGQEPPKWKLRQWKRRQAKAASAAAAASATNNKKTSPSSVRSVARRAKNDDKSVVDDDFSSRNMTLLRRFRTTRSSHKLLND